ncbi:hypothetical protein AAMO2058_000453500 [Amorphochlora amoebiformis]|mmetsp:Transcript_24116/g.37973  ORF Transcript_24116/g.37973 Transcript_24116/m.37973 type:complete len:152 (-) Transcript_24116:1496-1951(-)
MLSPFEIGRKRQNTRMNNSLTLGGMLVVAAICYFAASSRSAGSALAMAAPAPVRMRSVAIRASALNRDCRVSRKKALGLLSSVSGSLLVKGAFADEEKKVEEAAPTPTVVIPPELLIDPSEVQEIYEAKKNPTTGKMKQKLMTKPGTVTIR